MLLHTLLHFSAFWFEVLPGIAVSIWYPPCGLALALLVLLGPRYWPLIFITNFGAAWISAMMRAPWTAFFFPGLLTANYALVAWWVRRTVGSKLLPGTTRETLVFCAAIIVSPLISAIMGTGVITLTSSHQHPQTLASFLLSVRDWWIGDATGLLTVVPVVMVFLRPWLEGQPPPRNSKKNHALAWGMATLRGSVLLGTLILVLLVPVLREQRAFYLCFLPLVWICVYHGLRGATLATLSVMIVGLVGMRLAGTTIAYSYVFLVFEVAVAGVGLGLGTMVQRRDEAESRLATSNRELAKLRQFEFDEKITAQLSEEKSRLELLRYQLNPHFLYNSLNSIYGLLFENAKAAGEMVLRLSDFCRATLTDASDVLPTLEKEVAAMRSYLDVEKVRWQEKLKISINIAKNVETVRLPPFLLLPLVKNAIKYGGQTSPDVLELKIEATRNDETVHIKVSNTGHWLRADTSRPGSTGIGLENLSQRLQRYYPQNHRFTTEAKSGWVIAQISITGEARELPEGYHRPSTSAPPFGI